MFKITLLSILVLLSFNGCSKSSSTSPETQTPTTGTISLITSQQGTWFLNASGKKIDSLAVTYSTFDAQFKNVIPGSYTVTWRFGGGITATSGSLSVEAGKTTDVTFTWSGQSASWKVIGPR